MSRLVPGALVLLAAARGHAEPARPLVASTAPAMEPGAPVEPTLPQPPPIPLATPVLAIDDRRTHGPIAHNAVDLALAIARIQAPAGGSVAAMTAQLSAGIPASDGGDVHSLLSPYQPYQLRVRATAVHGADGLLFGPLTVGVQRYLPIAPVAMAPLAHGHAGVEIAVATPWLSDRFAAPPRAMQVVHAVDTELAASGWSVRPASGYLRVDFLACRTAYFELGGAPELFVPSTGATEYHMRYHAAVGWSFGCGHRAATTRPKVVIEYRGRGQLRAGDAPPAYRDALGIGLQLDLGGTVLSLAGLTNPGGDMTDHGAILVRVQVGLGKGA